MPKSLADQRAEKRTRRPRFSQTFCLAQDLLAEVQRLSNRRFELIGADETDDRPRKPRRGAADPTQVEAKRIRDRLAELETELADYTGDVWFEGIDLGEWMRWVSDHPARRPGEDGHEIDLRITAGTCNAQDLVDDLRRFAVSYNDDPITDEDWDQLVANGAAGDFADAARQVVAHHEQGVDLPKLRLALQGIRLVEID